MCAVSDAAHWFRVAMNMAVLAITHPSNTQSHQMYACWAEPVDELDRISTVSWLSWPAPMGLGEMILCVQNGVFSQVHGDCKGLGAFFIESVLPPGRDVHVTLPKMLIWPMEKSSVGKNCNLQEMSNCRKVFITMVTYHCMCDTWMASEYPCTDWTLMSLESFCEKG